MRSLIALVALLELGASFITAVVSLFSGQLLACLGFLLLAGAFSGVAKGLGY